MVNVWTVAGGDERAHGRVDRGAVAPGEFGYRVTTRQVPCTVAGELAVQALNAWSRWPGDRGVAGMRLTGSVDGPYIGRFNCSPFALRPDGGVREVCRHSADQHAGAITVKMTFRAAPGS